MTAIARPLPMSLPAAMQHLSVLEEAGLVRTAKVGRVRTCAIDPGALSRAEQWITAQRAEWQRRLDRLGALLEGTKETDDGEQ